MNNNRDIKTSLVFSLAGLLVCGILVLLCYFFVDRPVSQFVYEHHLADYPALKWLTYPPPVLQTVTPVVLAAFMVRRAWGPFHRWERALIAACVSIILADQFRETLSFGFGRYWPETWIDNNPSFIRDGAYGFHFFHGGSSFGSFPSGHAARTLAIAAPIWMSYPRLRWACILVSVAEGVALIGMNYHFVGDVIAGGYVGMVVGAWTFVFLERGLPK